MKHNHPCSIASVLFVSCLMNTSVLAANSVDVINYQGRLADSEGIPVADGAHEALVEIFDTPTPTKGQLPLWNSARDLTLHVLEGVFSVELGAGELFPEGLFDEYDDLYLRVTIGGEQLTPLQHITSTPYAMKAETADHAHTATTAANVVDGTVTGDLFVDGSIGINISAPGAGLHVVQTEDEDAFRVDDHDNDITPFVIDGSGSVAIGAQSPEAKLYVVMPHGVPTIPPVPSTVKGVVIRDGTFNTANQLEIQDDSGAARFVVDGGGKVGIGTAIPEGDLHVIGDTYAEGRVGIGTLDPQTQLDVDGTTRTSALEVNGGVIRVLSAGANTNTPVFRHVPSQSNSRCDNSGNACHETTIDHPMTNDDPSAILIVTPNGTVRIETDSIAPRVIYDDTEGRWKIGMRWWDLPNLSFNVLVVKR